MGRLAVRSIKNHDLIYVKAIIFQSKIITSSSISKGELKLTKTSQRNIKSTIVSKYQKIELSSDDSKAIRYGIMIAVYISIHIRFILQTVLK